MPHQSFRLNGVDLVADASGALWWPDRATLVVADLHLEKGSSFAVRGQFLPPYDTRQTLAGLEAAMTRLRPERVIALGDSFHDGGAIGRMPESDSARLTAMVAATDWIWIAGNHDPAPLGPWGGRIAEEITIGALVFRHEADPRGCAGEVSGHYHPKATVRARARTLSARCFVTDGERLVLPAFGAYAGGLDLFDPALRGLFGRHLQAFLLGRSRVVPFSFA